MDVEVSALKVWGFHIIKNPVPDWIYSWDKFNCNTKKGSLQHQKEHLMNNTDVFSVDQKEELLSFAC